jgi:hypothetical protein
MIPNKFVYKFLFVFLYDFSNKFKYIFCIFLIYLFLILFNNIKDFQVISSFFVVFIVLINKIISMNIVSMKQSFERYKKYLRLKRIRAHRFEELRLGKGSGKIVSD